MILLLGGTTEARLLLEQLIEERIPVIFSTAYDFAAEFIDSLADENPLVRHIAGKLDTDAMLALIVSEKIALVVDATHPFATGVTENARAASEIAGVSYLRVGRAVASNVDYENIEYVASMEEGAQVASRLGETIFLATGSNRARLFTEFIDTSTHRLYVRVLPSDDSVAQCLWAGFESEQIITGVGPFSVEDNERLWDSLGVNVVVTKESGREGGFPEKVEAAKRLGIALVVVARPSAADEELLDSNEVITVVRATLAAQGEP